MINKPILTVIIPVFNTSDVLSRCLNSLQNQVNKDIHIMIVDDCSTDNSLGIIKNFSENNQNVTYFSTPRQLGAGYARNIALKKTKTKYVTFLDSDDWVDSASYEKAIEGLEKNRDCDVAIFGIKTEFESPFASKVKCNYEYANIIDNRHALMLLCKTINYDLTISSMLGNKVFRTDLLRNNNICFIHNYFEDVYFSFISLFHSKYLCLINDTYLHYYQRADSVMHQFSIKYIDELLNIFLDLKKFLTKQNCLIEYNSEYYSFFNRSIYSLMNMIFSTEQNAIAQKEYIIYMIELLAKKFGIAEIINNLDIQLIKNIFNNN